MSDSIDYDALDPGIRDVVRAINEWGWPTMDSGDGVSKPADAECVLRFPHVFAETRNGTLELVHEAHALREALVGRFGDGWYVEVNYATNDRRAILCAQKDAPAIDTGDVVKHGPTGEEWLVAYVLGQHLAWCGWPSGLALISDCVLVKKATTEERVALLRDLAASEHDGRDRARAVLKAEGIPVAPTEPA